AIKTLRYAIIITVSFGLVVAVSTQFVADQIVALFTDDAKAIRLGGQYFRGYIWDCMFAGIHFSF
ncbi:MAG TPA: MATE family efflux transporter, partial [Clostridiales bacterium]|nr:MATE family efflux transporter [Clostridiales bacterium]